MKWLINKILIKIEIMKTIQKLLLVLLLITFFSCDNDDGNAPNENVCTYEGLTFEDINNNTQTFIPEADLTLEYFTATSNGPEVEVYETANPGNFNFTTIAVIENTSDTNTVNYNGNTYNNAAITCQRGLASGNTAGANVGDEFRWDIVVNSVEFEICMVVTSVRLGYVDADGDGCGSQTVSYSFGVLNNVDLDDSDPNVCF